MSSSRRSTHANVQITSLSTIALCHHALATHPLHVSWPRDCACAALHADLPAVEMRQDGAVEAQQRLGERQAARAEQVEAVEAKRRVFLQRELEDQVACFRHAGL
jgi:hypothetical protein